MWDFSKRSEKGKNQGNKRQYKKGIYWMAASRGTSFGWIALTSHGSSSRSGKMDKVSSRGDGALKEISMIDDGVLEEISKIDDVFIVCAQKAGLTTRVCTVGARCSHGENCVKEPALVYTHECSSVSTIPKP